MLLLDSWPNGYVFSKGSKCVLLTENQVRRCFPACLAKIVSSSLAEFVFFLLISYATAYFFTSDANHPALGKSIGAVRNSVSSSGKGGAFPRLTHASVSGSPYLFLFYALAKVSLGHLPDRPGHLKEQFRPRNNVPKHRTSGFPVLLQIPAKDRVFFFRSRWTMLFRWL
jgi:hypothetical protein